MKKVFGLLICSLAATFCFAQASAKTTATHLEKQTVEASCGECKFGMEGKGCALAVRIDNKAYAVEGARLDNYGDAHAAHGMCNEIRRAEVTGDIKDGKFIATQFKLLPAEKLVD